MQQVTLGSKDLEDNVAPILEDDVYVGAGAKVLGAVRVGRIDGQFVTNPTNSQLDESELDLVVEGDALPVARRAAERRKDVPGRTRALHRGATGHDDLLQLTGLDGCVRAPHALDERRAPILDDAPRGQLSRGAPRARRPLCG